MTEDQLTRLQEERLRRSLSLIAAESASLGADEQGRADEHDSAEGRDAGSEHGPGRDRPPRHRWPLAALAAVVVLVAVATLAVVGLRGGSRSPATGGRPAAAGEAGQTLQQWIACSRTIAIGDVVDVGTPTSGRVRVTLRVSQWIRPGTGADRITFDDVDPSLARTRPSWVLGGPVLVVVPAARDQPVDAFRGRDLALYRDRIESGLGEASAASCPPAFGGSSG